jgi:beta-glucanase (GH16 family)
MRRALAVAALTLALALVAPTARAAARLPLIWSDEFNGHVLDPGKWVIERDCWGGGNQERQCYGDAAANVAVSGGALCLTARQETAQGPARPPEQGASEIVSRQFTSGRIETKGLASFRYGRIEVRARLPMGQGLWPAIWMLPEHDNYGPFPRSGEIDIAEAVDLGVRCRGCRDEVRGSIHAGPSLEGMQSAGRATRLDPDAFHVFALEWTPRRMIWSVDGRRYFSRPTKKPFDERFHLILNLAVGGRWPETAGTGGVDAAALPATMMVDWVRVYGPPPVASLPSDR